MAHGSYFVFGCQVDDLLFKGFSSSSVGGLIGLCLFVMVLTLIFEGLKAFRQRISISEAGPSIKSFQREPGSPLSETSETSILKHIGLDKKELPFSKIKIHCLQTLLYMLQVTLAYFLMLIFMSYNIWLCLSILLASAIAYFAMGSSTLTTTLVVPLEDIKDRQIPDE